YFGLIWQLERTLLLLCGVQIPHKSDTVFGHRHYCVTVWSDDHLAYAGFMLPKTGSYLAHLQINGVHRSVSRAKDEATAIRCDRSRAQITWIFKCDRLRLTFIIP